MSVRRKKGELINIITCFSFYRLHYKEYLISKINKNKLDPIVLYTTNQIQQMLVREDIKPPDIEDEEQYKYRERLIEVSVVLML